MDESTTALHVTHLLQIQEEDRAHILFWQHRKTKKERGSQIEDHFPKFHGIT
jgi:hypothetical protein